MQNHGQQNHLKLWRLFMTAELEKQPPALIKTPLQDKLAWHTTFS
jgi:hypothetical protein